jgi:Homoserine dehydrogenase
MRILKIAMLGFGNAGRAFGRILWEKHDRIIADYGVDVRVTAIATGRHGTLVDANGIDILAALDLIESGGSFTGGESTMDVVRDAPYDVVLELTPLDIFTGQPAIAHLETALGRGKHAITANKGPVAWAYDRLIAQAEQQGVCFFCETTVMDGTPVFNLAADTLKYCKILKVEGILNSTTNFMLEELASGIPYDEILEEGRRRGFVEADPSMDIEGWDAAAKITAMLNVLMRANMTPMDVDRTGISSVTADDMKKAAAHGCAIKLLCVGERREDGSVHASVRPTEVPLGSIWAGITGTSSVYSITTDLMGKLTVVEHDPEIVQTGYGIFSDLVRVIGHIAPKQP